MVSFKGLFYPPNIMQCVNVLQACCTKVFQGALPIQLCCSDKFATRCLLFQFAARCDQNMKQEMAIHRYKTTITRFTHAAFIVIKREFTRYKMSGKYEYLSMDMYLWIPTYLWMQISLYLAHK